MKKINIILWVMILIAHISYGQSCLGDYPTDPCCNELIRTDPMTPSFAISNDRPYPFLNPTGYLKNTFNWLTPVFSFPNFTNLITNPFAQPTYSKYKMLNNYQSNMMIQQYLDQSLYHPKYGWELITANFNYNQYPDPNAIQPLTVDGPTIILYNKYLSKMLILASPGSSSNYDQTIFSMDFDYDVDKLRPKEQNQFTACLFNDYIQSQALDTLTKQRKVEITAAPAGPLEWAFGETPVSYDPCVCQFPGKLRIETHAYSSSAVKLEGRGIGTSVLLNNSGNPNLQQGRDWLNSVWTIDELNPNSTKYNWVVQGGVQTYSNIDKLAASYKQDPLWSAVTNILNTAGSLPGTALGINIGSDLNDLIDLVAPSFVQNLIDSTAKSKIAGTKLTIGNILSGGSSFFSSYIGGSTPRASIMEFEMQLQGRIFDRHKMTSVKDIEFYTPGSYTSNQANKPWTSYPMYNEAMGIIALLKKPAIKYDFSYSEEFSSSPERFEEPANAFSITKKKLERIYLSFDEPIQYTLNPAAEINLDKSKILATVEFDIICYVKNKPPMTNGLANSPIFEPYNYNSQDYYTNYLNNILNGLKTNMSPDFIISRVDYSDDGDTMRLKITSNNLPIDNVNKLYFDTKVGVDVYKQIYFWGFEGGYGDMEFLFDITNPKVKILCDLVHLSNPYGVENRSLHNFTYSANINKIDAYDYGYKEEGGETYGWLYHYKNPLSLKSTININNKLRFSDHYPTNKFFTGIINFNNNQTIYCNDLSILNATIQTANNVTITIKYFGSVTIENSTISPNVIIEPYEPLINDNLLEPLDNSVVKQFCKGSLYKAKEPVLKSSTPQSLIHSERTAFITLHPNPSKTSTMLTLLGFKEATATISVHDMMGKMLYSQVQKTLMTTAPRCRSLQHLMLMACISSR